ncbi:MAG TPA: hypothetical protein VI819_03840 [Patescibacteria group bacterium]|nr:hypothetical protein [Patescibacteria group bacterium]
MPERFSNITPDQTVQLGHPDDPFGLNGEKIPGLSTRQILKDVVEDNRGYIKTAALLLPLTLVACTGQSPDPNSNADWAVMKGHITGAIFGLEELVEKDPDRNVPKKIFSTGLKILSGEVVYHAINGNLAGEKPLFDWKTWFSINDGSLNLRTAHVIVALGLAAHETSGKQFIDGVMGFFVEKAQQGGEIVAKPIINLHESNKSGDEIRRQETTVKAKKLFEKGDVNAGMQALVNINYPDNDIIRMAIGGNPANREFIIRKFPREYREWQQSTQKK